MIGFDEVPSDLQQALCILEELLVLLNTSNEPSRPTVQI